jgi:hypothetical protein
VAQAGQQLGDTSLTCPATPAGETTYWIRASAGAAPPISDVIAFSDPGSPDLTNGVVLYNDSGFGSASEDTCTPPSSNHALCTAIVNNFVGQAWLMKT